MTEPAGMVRYIGQHDRGRTAAMVFLLAVAGLLEGVGIAAVLPLLDIVLSTGSGTPSQTGLSLALERALNSVGLPLTLEAVLGAMVVAFALKGLMHYLAVLQVGTVVAAVGMELRLRLLRAVARAEWKHTLRYPSGFISNAVSAETGRTAMAYQEFAQVVAEGMQVLAYLAVAFVISWHTATAAIVVGLVILAVLQSRVTASKRAGRDQVLILRSILAKLTDALPSLKPLKAMGMEQYLLPRLEELTRAYFVAQKREIASTELLKKAREPLLVAALCLGLWLALRVTSLESTSLMVLAMLFYRAVTSITNMQQRWVSVVVGENSFQSLMEHIHASEQAQERWMEAGSLRPPSFERELVIEDLHFSFEDHPVFRGAHATFRAGRFIALVGPSGAGKTTLTDLITGLLQPDRGRILVDGVDLHDVDIRLWRRSIGYVPQSPMLFSDTVRANITLGAPDITEAQVTAALQRASAMEFVAALPQGLDQPIGEGGVNLSGGQAQRLAIARALVRDPGLLILDEPTTALDSASEEEVCAAIADLKGLLSVLAISHQPAIRRLADEIWEIDDGLIRPVDEAQAERWR